MQASSVERYESRNAVGISEAVKWQHVLPFLPALVSYTAACERAVSEGDTGEPLLPNHGHLLCLRSCAALATQPSQCCSTCPLVCIARATPALFQAHHDSQVWWTASYCSRCILSPTLSAGVSYTAASMSSTTVADLKHLDRAYALPRHDILLQSQRSTLSQTMRS